MSYSQNTGLATLGKRLPSLDGWRAVSIILVLGAHSKWTHGFPDSLKHSLLWFFPGDLGVRFFFTISGLLITWLLLQEQAESHTINLKFFYARRALRIFPVYFAFLAVIFLLQCITPFHQSTAVWISDLTFTTNFCNKVQSEVAWTTGHLWSLSTEEQFYLLWPGLLILFKLHTHWKRAVAFTIAAILIAPVFRFAAEAKLYPQQLSWAFSLFSFGRYFDALALGCGLAVLLAHQPEALKKYLTKLPALWYDLAAAMCIAIPYYFTHKNICPAVSIPLGHSFEGLGFAILLTRSLFLPSTGWHTFLNWKWVTRLGILSYSIYIWQMIFCTAPIKYGITYNPWWLSFPGWLGAAFIAAVLSYYLIEKPFLKYRKYFH